MPGIDKIRKALLKKVIEEEYEVYSCDECGEVFIVGPHGDDRNHLDPLCYLFQGGYLPDVRFLCHQCYLYARAVLQGRCVGNRKRKVIKNKKGK